MPCLYCQRLRIGNSEGWHFFATPFLFWWPFLKGKIRWCFFIAAKEAVAESCPGQHLTDLAEHRGGKLENWRLKTPKNLETKANPFRANGRILLKPFLEFICFFVFFFFRYLMIFFWGNLHCNQQYHQMLGFMSWPLEIGFWRGIFVGCNNQWLIFFVFRKYQVMDFDKLLFWR